MLPTNLIMMKGLNVLGCPAAISVHRDPSLKEERLARIFDWVSQGQIQPHVAHTFPMDDVREALLHAVGELLYTYNLAQARELDLLEQPMPLIKTGCDPLGVKEASQSVITNRRQALVEHSSPPRPGFLAGAAGNLVGAGHGGKGAGGAHR